MIKVPKELQRLIIKEKFRDLHYKVVVNELNRLARTDDIKNLLSKFEHLIDVDFTDSEPEFDISDDSFSVGWLGSMRGRPVRVDIVWDYGGKFRNYILAIDESGEEEVLLEL